jgi:hypothetical protein
VALRPRSPTFNVWRAHLSPWLIVSCSVILLPFPVPTRLVPVLLCLVYQLWFGLQLHALSGLLVGYVLSLLPSVFVPDEWLRLLERGAFAQHEHFISLQKAGKSQPWSPYVHDGAEASSGSGVSPGAASPPAAIPVPLANARLSAAKPVPLQARGTSSVAQSRTTRGDASSSPFRHTGAGLVQVSSSKSISSGSGSSTTAAVSSDEEEEAAMSPRAKLNSTMAASVGTSASSAASAAVSSSPARAHSPASQRSTSALFAANVARILEP